MIENQASFDVITFAPAWTPDFAPYLSVMPEEIRQTDVWEDIHEVYRDRLMIWGGEHKSQTIDGDLHTLQLPPRPVQRYRRAGGVRGGVRLSRWPRRRPGTSTTTSPSSSPRPEENLWGTSEAFRRGWPAVLVLLHPCRQLHQPPGQSGRHVLRPGDDGRPDQQSGLGACPGGLYPLGRGGSARLAQQHVGRRAHRLRGRLGGDELRLGRHGA